MATARVLPSGQWRCLVFDGMENGKRKYKSFTAATKNDAELQAKQYLADPSRKNREQKLTVKDAIERYISSKEGVLSPSTIYGYRRMQRNRYESIGKLKIQELTSEDMQKFMIGYDDDSKTVTIPVFNEENKLVGVIGRYISSKRKKNERYKIYDHFERSRYLYPENFLKVKNGTTFNEFNEVTFYKGTAWDKSKDYIKDDKSAPYLLKGDLNIYSGAYAQKLYAIAINNSTDADAADRFH